MANLAADLAAVLAQRAGEIEDVCLGLSAGASARRLPDGRWSVREHLSHLYGDDRESWLAGVERAVIEGVDALDAEPGITHYSVDRSRVALPALVSAVAGQYRALADLASRLEDVDLERPLRVDMFGQTRYGATPTLAGWLAAIADAHLPDHIAQIREARGLLGE